MNIELSTDNLTKVCRICLHLGVVNIRKYKVRLNPIDTTFEDLYDDTDTAVTINEIMQIFNKWEHNVWDLSDELHMICNQCLDDIVGTYLFYKKLEHANQHIKRLYKAALELECDASEKDSGTEYIDQILMDNDGDVETFEDVPPEAPVAQTSKVESTCPILESAEPTMMSAAETGEEEVNYEEEEKFIEEPLYLRSATEMIPEIHTPDEYVCTEQFSYVPEIQKRNESSWPEEHINKRARRASEYDDGKKPALDNASLVIGQFIPSVSDYNADTQADGDETCGETKLHTVEYAPVQIKGDEINIIKNYKSLAVGQDGIGASAKSRDGQSIYMCKYCPKAYSAANYLIVHTQKCHVCQHCMQAFNKDTDLYEHLKLNHRNNECKICHKHLSSKSNLRAHMKRVHGLQLPANVTLMGYRQGPEQPDEESEQVEQSNQEPRKSTAFDDKIDIDVPDCDFVNSIIECDFPI